MNAGKVPEKLRNLIICTVCFFAVSTLGVGAQTPDSGRTGVGSLSRRLTMEQTIALAQEQSISSMVNENIYAAAHWRYRSYRARRLPSLHFSAGIANINRSIQPIPDANTGLTNYIPVFTLSNNASLFVQQNISVTGGTISFRSDLQRFDQFNPGNLTWYSQPFTMQYTQPLFSYNAMKWEKKIEPRNYEAARIDYIERMESVTINAASYFWALAMAELNRNIDVDNYENSKRLHRIAKDRYTIGAIPRSEVLQMELRVLSDSIAIATSQIAYITQKNRLASFVGLREDTAIELDVDYTLPDITLNYGEVLANALRNSSFELRQKIELLNAESEIARQKANRGIDISFNARFGLSQSGDSFSSAYSRLQNQQVAGFSIGIPILDWGMGKGYVKMAQSQAETIRYQQEQARIDYEQDIFVKVMEFNAQKAQCDGALRRKNIADERFALSVDSYERGTLSVTDLNTAQSDKDNAQREYISSLSTYWNSYFNLRRISLYDYLSRTDIGALFGDAEFNKLIE